MLIILLDFDGWSILVYLLDDEPFLLFLYEAIVCEYCFLGPPRAERFLLLLQGILLACYFSVFLMESRVFSRPTHEFWAFTSIELLFRTFLNSYL